jgi:hypothetical protein
VLIYDRLWHNAVAVGSGAQAISMSALTRYTTGAGVEAWWETYNTMGAGTPTVTLSYTDQDGNAETTGSSGALSTTMATGRTGMFTLAAGDTGVRAITGWNASATFSSGTIGAVLRRRIATIPFGGGTEPIQLGPVSVGLPQIQDDACLEFLMFQNGSGSIIVHGTIHLIQG